MSDAEIKYAVRRTWIFDGDWSRNLFELPDNIGNTAQKNLGWVAMRDEWITIKLDARSKAYGSKTFKK
jgi:hypothetical protein